MDIPRFNDVLLSSWPLYAKPWEAICITMSISILTYFLLDSTTNLWFNINCVWTLLCDFPDLYAIHRAIDVKWASVPLCASSFVNFLSFFPLDPLNYEIRYIITIFIIIWLNIILLNTYFFPISESYWCKWRFYWACPKNSACITKYGICRNTIFNPFKFVKVWFTEAPVLHSKLAQRKLFFFNKKNIIKIFIFSAFIIITNCK